MNDDVKPLQALLREMPPDKLLETVDSVLIDYAIASVIDEQTQPPQEAANNIRFMKRLRDALYLASLDNITRVTKL